MMRSQTPLGVKAGIFYVFSFEFLLAVSTTTCYFLNFNLSLQILQASYTYMMILTEIDNELWN
jgi:hypothetical protein